MFWLLDIDEFRENEWINNVKVCFRFFNLIRISAKNVPNKTKIKNQESRIQNNNNEKWNLIFVYSIITIQSIISSITDSNVRIIECFQMLSFQYNISRNWCFLYILFLFLVFFPFWIISLLIIHLNWKKTPLDNQPQYQI